MYVKVFDKNAFDQMSLKKNRQLACFLKEIMMRGGRKDEVANLVTPSVTTATIDLAKATASILVTRQPKSDPKMESEQISIARSSDENERRTYRKHSYGVELGSMGVVAALMNEHHSFGLFLWLASQIFCRPLRIPLPAV